MGARALRSGFKDKMSAKLNLERIGHQRVVTVSIFHLQR